MRVLLSAALALLASPASADFVGSRYSTGGHYYSQIGLSGERSGFQDRALTSRDLARQEARYQRAAAFGRCVVDGDEAASTRYVLAGAGGRERQAFGEIRDLARSCRHSTAPGLSVLNHGSVRLSAIADALRARQP